MDNTTFAGGSGDRRSVTVSSPSPRMELEKGDVNKELSPESKRLTWASSSVPSTPQAPMPSPGKQPSHRRSISGNILAKFNFLNRSPDDGRPPSRDVDKEGKGEPASPSSVKSRKSIDDDEPVTSPVSPVRGETAMAAALASVKPRKRKGSLRKTALMGTRRLVTETRERRNSVLQRSPSTKKQTDAQKFLSPTGSHPPPVPSRESEIGNPLKNKFSYENLKAASSSNNNARSQPAATPSTRLSLVTDTCAPQESRKTSSELASPLDLKGPPSLASYASTTDDDDPLTFDRPLAVYMAPQRELSLKKPLSTNTTGYFPSLPPGSDAALSRRMSAKNRSSPLSHSITTLPTFPEPEYHDYTETEYWGWVILIATWLIFTVGMGSCLEIWSWAWDVGETPYAPPELEDDPTLPIVGYYPALIVLTGVVAWVWITVAWLGMKYFRHAKIEM